MIRSRHLVLPFAACLTATAALAADGTGLKIQPVTNNVWAIVGEMVQRSPENLANNATFGVVVTEAGVLLVDPGGSWNGALAIDAAIDEITEKPVKFVINTGGQDHRWLGNGYWKQMGATIVASEDAVADQRDRASQQLTGLANLIGEQLAGTEPVFADVLFSDEHVIEFGGLEVHVIHPSAAHTPGDSFVWVPDRSTVMTGDIVYVERILGIGEQSSITEWPLAFEAIEALQPAHVVPGHGHPTTLDRARADTYDYLMNIRSELSAHIDAGGDILSAVDVDQGEFSYLLQYDALARRNAQTAFQQMEWE